MRRDRTSCGQKYEFISAAKFAETERLFHLNPDLRRSQTRTEDISLKVSQHYRMENENVFISFMVL